MELGFPFKNKESYEHLERIKEGRERGVTPVSNHRLVVLNVGKISTNNYFPYHDRLAKQENLIHFETVNTKIRGTETGIRRIHQRSRKTTYRTDLKDGRV